MNPIIYTLALLTLPMAAVGVTHDPSGSSDPLHEVTSDHSAHDEKIGRQGNLDKVNRTVEITVNDTVHFTPSLVDVKVGDTVLFVVKNVGQFSHEMIIGSMTELRAHALLMQKASAIEHAQANMIVLNPGQQRTVVWQFTRSGKIDFACLIDWHLKFGTLGEMHAD